jgi:hypothetical protein
MIAKIRPIPNPWPAGTGQQVVVDITDASPTKTVDVTLFQTAPSPETQLGAQTVNVTSSGAALALFSVTLSTSGINVLHCEAERGPDFDSDSAGTVVT